MLYTKADAKVNNYAGYIQNGTDFFNGHLRVETGLRFDYFNFDVKGFESGIVNENLIGKEGAGRFQPKLAVALSPFERIPVTFYRQLRSRNFFAGRARRGQKSRFAESFDDRFLSGRNEL